MITLKPVDEHSVEACAQLKCTPEQQRFTNSPIWSLLQTAYTPLKEYCVLYAIWSDDTVVGMVRLDYSLFDEWYEFTNLLIDKAYQRRHYAAEAIRCIIGLFRAEGRFRFIRIQVDPENSGAIRLYEKSGFTFRGPSEDGVFNEYEYSL